MIRNPDRGARGLLKLAAAVLAIVVLIAGDGSTDRELAAGVLALALA